MNRISIIIPTLNEEDRIGRLLPYLIEYSSPENISDIIIVDGGSTDNTLKILEGIKHITLIHSEPGRARQLNRGALAAKGTVLYFLHADSLPPKDFDRYILKEIDKGNLAGCFRLKFDSNHWWLKLAGWFTRFNWQMCRGGDQSLFITKELFNDLGGYDESYAIYEDNILTAALFKKGMHTVIQRPIVSSSRLYKAHGIWKLQYHFWNIHLKHRKGASAEQLLNYYHKHIASKRT